ncbi:5436_t:CDS:10 [Cetraspora pellucida]|uniref:5436_t:CDS:1 n=1 Tax=Cetraspora pellucida TaxID=1433469 RepID=A0ACA9KLL9_9GLOM|nr:5436_t:CDS:10 [Cetraspora pellucida]
MKTNNLLVDALITDPPYSLDLVNKKNFASSNPCLIPEYVGGVVFGEERIHPTQKNLQIIKDIISLHTNSGDLVLDPFMGSGTTAAACKELGPSARLEKLNVSKPELELGKDDLLVLIAEAEAHISKLEQEIIVDESKIITKDYAMLDKRLLSKKQTKEELEKIVQKWKETIKLNLKNENLEGKLIVSDLPNLEKIECDDNNFVSIELINLPKLNYFRANNCHLTDVKFENCPEIKYLNISNNRLTEINFLNGLNPERLTTLSIHSNNFPEQTLEIFIDTGCAKIRRELEGVAKITGITEKLFQNEALESLGEDVLRDNPNLLSQNLDFLTPFVGLEELNIESKEDKDGTSELSKLQSPEQFSKFNYLSGVEYASTVTTVVGGALTLLDFSTTGGVITLTAPLIGAGASQLKSNFYEVKKAKWEEFKTDADTFLDNYNELLGILKQIGVNESKSTVNLAFQDLKKKVYTFLNDYDDDGNEEIDIEELIEEREKFAKELNDKVKKIIETMKELEEQVINYRQGSEDKEEDVEEKEIKLAIEKLPKELMEKQKLEEFKHKLPEKLSQREIIKIIPLVPLGQRDERQFLIISQNKNLFGLFGSSKEKYALDLIEQKVKEIELDRKTIRILKELKKKDKERNDEEIKKENLISKIKKELEKQESELENNAEILCCPKDKGKSKETGHDSFQIKQDNSQLVIENTSEQKEESSEAQIEIPPKILANAQSEGEKMGVVKAFEFCYELKVGSARDVFRKQLRYPYRFYAYGSRVKGTARKFSDLDLCYQEEMPWNVYGRVKEDLEESNLPFKVDLVFWG